MYLIVDVNISHKVFLTERTTEFKPVFTWLKNGFGRIVYGGKNKKELNRNKDVAREIVLLDSAGQAFFLGNDDLLEEISECIKTSDHYESNDAHILALARVSGSRLLCSHDKELQKDFKKKPLLGDSRGRTYQNKSHKRLLYGKSNFSPPNTNLL